VAERRSPTRRFWFVQRRHAGGRRLGCSPMMRPDRRLISGVSNARVFMPTRFAPSQGHSSTRPKSAAHQRLSIEAGVRKVPLVVMNIDMMTFAARDFSARHGASDEHIPKWICEERATKSGRKRTAARRVAPNLACGVVARRLTHGVARRLALPWAIICQAFSPASDFGTAIEACCIAHIRQRARRRLGQPSAHE